LATSLSILLSLANTTTVKLMKQKGHHRRLIRFFRSGISISFLWALMSALLTTFHWEKGGIWRHAALCIWAYIGICSILCYYRASEMLLEILMLEHPPLSDVVPEWPSRDDGPPLKLDLSGDND
jgi:hypothetical protein